MRLGCLLGSGSCTLDVIDGQAEGLEDLGVAAIRLARDDRGFGQADVLEGSDIAGEVQDLDCLQRILVLQGQGGKDLLDLS